MSRINYQDDEDYPGQFNIWNANVLRSVKGRAGQLALRELEAALLALPTKRLIRGALADDGEVCAVGCLVLALRVKAGEDRAEVLTELEASDPDDDEAAQRLATPLGIPHMVGWKLVALNDIELKDRWQLGGQRFEDVTPEERYMEILAWVQEHILRSVR